ncbi:Zinc finger CCHC-type [Venturia nashicola]|uniref:Zinc finger CCHC-type n=1 Tax=Venturia nashicola TaxID=86259 RepID=A0A4Z1NYM8_9PEZI|nr:Zinc finger CCHC-type [Venturia nashicola]
MELEIGSQTARHRSSTPASQYSRPPKELQPEKLSPYEGKSVRAHRDWTRSAENAFRLAPNTFGTEIAKISYALQFIKGTPYSSWVEKEPSLSEDQLTWEYFRTFLLDLIEDPVNRQLEAMQHYMDSKQGADQSTVSFNSYLMGLESQLDEPYTETQLRNHLWCKLRPEIRGMLSNYQEIPKTRDAIVALATRLESNKRKASTSKPSERDQKRRLPQHDAKSGSRPPASSAATNSRLSEANSTPIQPKGGNKDLTTIQCFNCRQMGHYANNCKEPKKEREIAELASDQYYDPAGNESASP